MIEVDRHIHRNGGEISAPLVVSRFQCRHDMDTEKHSRDQNNFLDKYECYHQILREILFEIR